MLAVVWKPLARSYIAYMVAPRCQAVVAELIVRVSALPGFFPDIVNVFRKRRMRSGDALAAPDSAPADPCQVDLEDAIEGAAVPDLTEAQLRKGADAAAKLGARIDVEAVHADWRRHVAGMGKPLYSPVGHWIASCKRRARARKSG